MSDDKTCSAPGCEIVLSVSRPYGDLCFTHHMEAVDYAVAAEHEGDETVEKTAYTLRACQVHGCINDAMSGLPDGWARICREHYDETVDEAQKFDSDKLRYDLVPPEAMEALASVLTYGAKKYSDRNWERGDLTERMFAALERHLWAWRAGESNDAESGMPHLSHALCCAAMLVAYEKRVALTDAKWPPDVPDGIRPSDTPLMDSARASVVVKKP